MFAIQSSSVSDILLRRIRVDTESFSDLGDSLRPEGPFCVDVGDFTLGSSHFLRKLCYDGYGVGELGLPAAELAVDFADAHALEATAEAVSLSENRLYGNGYTNPPRMESNCLLPVDILTTRFR